MTRQAINGEFAYTISIGGLAGWISKDLREDLLAELLGDPGGLLNDSSSRILRHSTKLQVAKQTLKGRGGAIWNIVIKRFHYTSFVRRLGLFFLPSPALRSLQGALLLKGKGVDTARPLAALEHRSWRNFGISYYVAEEITGGQSLSAFWRDVVPTFPGEKVIENKRQILSEMASLFYKLHSRGIYHRDLKGSNILIRKQDKGTWKCFLVDVDSIRRSRRLSWLKRIKNLVQLCSSVGRYLNIGEKTFFLNYYADLFYLPTDRRKALASKVLSMSRDREVRTLRGSPGNK